MSAIAYKVNIYNFRVNHIFCTSSTWNLPRFICFHLSN